MTQDDDSPFDRRPVIPAEKSRENGARKKVVYFIAGIAGGVLLAVVMSIFIH